VSNTWPSSGPQQRPPRLEHIATFGLLLGIYSTCIAGLYRNNFGIELRIDLGNELIESRLFCYGEEPAAPHCRSRLVPHRMRNLSGGYSQDLYTCPRRGNLSAESIQLQLSNNQSG